MSDFREIVRGAVARAKERAAPSPPPEPPPSPYDVMQQMLVEHWTTVLSSDLIALQKELANAGVKLHIAAPGIANVGSVELDVDRDFDSWTPCVRFDATQDGTKISVSLTAGKVKEYQPHHETIYVRALTAPRIAEYIARIMDQAKFRIS